MLENILLNPYSQKWEFRIIFMKLSAPFATIFNLEDTIFLRIKRDSD